MPTVSMYLSRQLNVQFFLVVLFVVLFSIQFEAIFYQSYAWHDDYGTGKDDIITCQQTQQTSAIMSNHSPRRRKVVLLGPHDRFNFGDLLFEKVVTRLLVERAGYHPDDLISAGIVTRDMSDFGGSSSILSLKTVQKLSFETKQPFDIIYLGGEAAGCSHGCGVDMLDSKRLQKSAEEDKIYDCAYVLPKEELIPPGYRGSSNMAIVNSMGRVEAIEPCQRAIDSADYRSFRNTFQGSDYKLVPDSAVVTRKLFGDFIDNVDNFPDVKEILLEGDYIAVQYRSKALRRQGDAFAAVLDTIAAETNRSIVFFAAGTVSRHDSFRSYQRVADKMNATTYVLKHEPNVWKVVATIAHAKAVVSTSLHARIMAFQFQKPRVTLCEPHGKHYHFIKHWEKLSSESICYQINQTALALRKSVPMNIKQIEEIEDAYLDSFDLWSNMLLHGKRRNVTRLENNTVVDML